MKKSVREKVYNKVKIVKIKNIYLLNKKKIAAINCTFCM